jgi:putative acetyltransferase
VPFVVLLGHPEYYPRFGFRPAFDYGLTFAGQQPHPAAMALELRSGAMTGLCGEIRYLPPFNET